MSYNNSTYIGIRKQVTQHLYKFFSHLHQRLEYRDNYFFKMKFLFFLYWLLSAL